MKNIILFVSHFGWLIRKSFHTPNKKELELINEQYLQIVSLSHDDDREYSKRERRYENNHNCECPHCGNKDESKIVNKISRVQGSGSVSGSFRLGYGSVYGSSSTDTFEVNHCSLCGNEWKKYKYNVKWSTDFLADYLNDIYKHREEDGNYYKKTVERFQKMGIYAETFVFISYNTNFHNQLYYHTIDNIRDLDYMRSLFPSVYDVTKV